MRPKRSRPDQQDVLQGTLDMLVLQSLLLGPAHGYTIVNRIQQRSDDRLQIGQGSLYPALHRLEGRKWIGSYWATSENNRRARYYRLTPAGGRQLADETSRWQQLVHAVGRVLRPVDQE
jgi:PadR family transcriptional regulator, regulatory protein PadR